MIVVDKNVMTVDPKEILSAHVTVTIIGGEVVYERK